MTITPTGRLLKAARNLSEAQQRIIAAEREFTEAVAAVELAEAAAAPNYREMRGVLKSSDNA